MEKSEKLHSAWEQLALESWVCPGIYERRFAADTAHVLYATLLRPTGLIGLALEVSVLAGSEMEEDSARGLVLKKEWRQDANVVRFSLMLTDLRYRETFEVLVTDIVEKILRASNRDAGISVLKTRLDHWKRFLQAVGDGGLSVEAQVGLYGELCVLRGLLATRPKAQADVLNAWCGPSGGNQDFWNLNRAVEVKTSTSNEVSRVQIASEHQLDEEGMGILLLCHLGVDRRRGSGQTLPLLVKDIATTIDESLIDLFHDLLAAAGYHALHESNYSGFGYSSKFANIYRVDHQFPRIKSGELRTGVLEVRYLIDLSNIAPVFTDIGVLADQLFGV